MMRIRLAKKILANPFRYSIGKHEKALRRLGKWEIVSKLSDWMEDRFWNAPGNPAIPVNGMEYWINKENS